jgi:hypothetical protein
MVGVLVNVWNAKRRFLERMFRLFGFITSPVFGISSLALLSLRRLVATTKE